jgi:hypothetical protein
MRNAYDIMLKKKSQNFEAKTFAVTYMLKGVKYFKILNSA